MSYYPIEDYVETDLDKLKEIWEPRKEYIEKDLWVIRNFLSEDEMSFLKDLINDPKDWYTTMRSPYGGNIKNKFVGYIAEYNEDGIMILPGPNSKIVVPEIWNVDQRAASVVVPEFTGAGALQSFFEVPDEVIIAKFGRDVDFAMDFHYERDNEDKFYGQPDTFEAKSLLSAAISIYINDDYDGGELVFKNKDYVIKPEPGMLVNVPLYKEFEHKVNKVTNGNRHTLYGKSWESLAGRHVSTNEDC